MGLIPDEIIAQVIDRNDIAETIAGYIPLKRVGRNLKGLCPFHHEKTPSFIVNPDKQIFHCFGCGVGGNVVSFVMRQENLQFPEAVRVLAARSGIAIPDQASESSQTTSLKERLYKVNELAVEFYHGNLMSSKRPEADEARKYFQRRGISLETAKTFKLGYAFDEWDALLNCLRQKDVPLSLIEQAGLIIPRERRDGFYDRFRLRVIFPIFDTKGRCVGFGGRTLKQGEAKYVNSPETALYTKGKHLYGFHISKEAIRQNDAVVVTEGYFDFLVPYQMGAKNVIASLGTALTIEQIRLLRRYTHNIIMLYDADAAGESAMLRSLDLFLEEGLNVKIATLTSGDDPDSFVRKNGLNIFQERIDQALPFFDYKLGVLLKRYNGKTVEGKSKISNEILPTMNRVKNAVIKFSYIKQLSEAVGVPEEALLIELQKLDISSVRKAESLTQSTVASSLSGANRTVEHNILRLLFEEKSAIEFVKKEVTPEDFQDENVKKIVAHIFHLFDHGQEISVQSVMKCFYEEQMVAFIAELMAATDVLMGDREKICRDCVLRIKQDRLKFLRQDLQHQIKEAEYLKDHTRLEELKEKFNQLIKR